LTSGPVEPIQPSGGSGMVRVLAITAIAVLVVVALILVGVLAVLLTSARPMKPAAVEQYVDAAEQGDWEAAAALAARAATQPDEPVARLILAMDAAMAGERHQAREHLGDPEYYADPLRSRAWVLTAGLHRSQPNAYDDAAEAYGHGLDCAGEGCGDVIDAARDGLALSCTMLDDPRPEACARTETPTWTSGAERQLVRSVVLRTDGQTDDAAEALQAGLDSMATETALGCGGMEALRDWMASGALQAGSELERTVQGAGRSAARTAEDCNTFRGPAVTGQPR